MKFGRAARAIAGRRVTPIHCKNETRNQEDKMFESYELAETAADMSLHASRDGAGPAIRNICVFCGSRAGVNPAFSAAGKYLGIALAREGIGLIYGGGGGGLMGTVARAALAAGGQVTGIIPAFLKEREEMLQGDHELIVVDDMHARKRLMFERADAFVALPGGIGTLEELVEQMTWAQLGQHRKPVLLADVNGFWQPFLALLQHMSDSGFVQSDCTSFPIVSVEVEDILPGLHASRLDRWAAAPRAAAGRASSAARCAPALEDFDLTDGAENDVRHDVYECRPPSLPQPWEDGL
jgi:uncharacterized protein (TIGR00730 family)